MKQPYMKPTYLRLSVTDACNQCCIYCRPANCVSKVSRAMSVDEIRSVVELLAGFGINKIRITGGEPLLRGDLPEIVHTISSTPGIESVGLTTNGFLLAGCVKQLKQSGITHINISLDSLHSPTYERITGADSLSAVLEGVYAALECFDSLKTNTVVMKGINDGEIADIAALSCDLPVETRFIELMPMHGSVLDWQSMFVPAREILRRIGDLEPVSPVGSSTAKTFKIPGSKESIGVIAPVSEPFCESCNRVRVNCSGLLKPCLRLPLSYDILQAANAPDAIEAAGEMFDQAQSAKWELLPQMAMGAVLLNSMSSIGG